MSDEKYVGPVAAAKNVLLTKAALGKKLDKTGGTMTGDLTVNGACIKAKSLDNVGGDIKADRAVSAYNFIIDTGVGDKMAIFKTGDTAAAFRSTPGADYIRFAVGTPTGDNDAATKAYVDSKVTSGGVTVDTEMSSTSENPVQNKVVKTALDAKLDKTGGTLTGNLTGKYITGTWLQSTATSDLGRTPSRIAVLDDSGWVYYRTPAELMADMGLSDGTEVSY